MRYTPIVKYNKVHLPVRGKDLLEFLKTSACNEVGSGANVQIPGLSNDELLYDSREVKYHQVASPVQVYLDCMKLKGRGKEMADAIFAKEIQK